MTFAGPHAIRTLIGFNASHGVAHLSGFLVVPQASKPIPPAAIQPNLMADIINLNTAGTKELTQLPGVAKNVA
ncbi:MAG TPA: hypothetical protein VFM77_06525 [Terriglobales bacterium]|nr:hypothetical protein [Terriglobales bacterium]